jgi:hypothetical protein
MPKLGCWWFVVGLAAFVLVIWGVGWMMQRWEERRGEGRARRGFAVVGGNENGDQSRSAEADPTSHPRA